MTTLSDIKKFMETDKIAVAGVSRDRKKFGYAIYKELTDKGYTVYPVNPNTDTIDDVVCYRDITSLPEDVKHLHIVTPRDETAELVRQAIDKGIRNIWIQWKSDTPDAVERAKENKVNLIHRKCIMMYAEPVRSVHRFHRTLVKFFGLYPK